MTAMELRPDSQGKVRDIYDAGDSLLMVASDRISAFDYILPDEIPYKGEVLSRISAFWFEKLADVVPNHLVSMDPRDFPAEFLPYEEYLSGRAMLVRKAEPIKIECVVRGYLTGSIKEAYDATGEVDGIALPAGLVEASPLPEPLFTPSTKADVGIMMRTSPMRGVSSSSARTWQARFEICRSVCTRRPRAMPEREASSSRTPSSNSASSMAVSR